ncbi:hypothetical protein B0H14DRAFT_501916 [Mycena olivaceomarginata]|nr:hypothetical protein B0H14DRAFT_501916 [Mycena olivaceomarginata]
MHISLSRMILLQWRTSASFWNPMKTVHLPSWMSPGQWALASAEMVFKSKIWFGAFYTCPSQASNLLIQNIFITHFDAAIVVLRDVVGKSASNTNTIQWVLYTIIEITMFLSTPNQVALLQVSARTINHFGAILASRESDWEWILGSLFDPIFHNLQRTGLLNGALEVCEQVIKFLKPCSQSDDRTVEAGYWQLRSQFILCDMGRFSDAIGMIQHTTMALVPERSLLLPHIVQIRILHRVGRNQEALQLLKRGVAASHRKYWTNSVKVFQLQLNFLLAESAAIWGYIGNGERALKHAEWAVATCRKDIGPNEDMEDQKYILIHSLVTLSNCLATLERNNEALTAAQEAVLAYTENVLHMWEDFAYTIRKQELGANAFHALSLRLVTSGTAEQALLNAETATKITASSSCWLLGTFPLSPVACGMWVRSSGLWAVETKPSPPARKRSVSCRSLSTRRRTSSQI